MTTILLVEDDQHLRFGIAFNLRKEGYEVVDAGSAEEAEARLASGITVDLGLFDVMLPGRSGLELLAALRTRGRSFPVLMLTARSDETDAVTALSLGADDYVRKPFGVSELAARIAAVLRRGPAAATGGPRAAPRMPVRIGGFDVDLENFRARGAAGEIALTAIETELLRVLLERPCTVVKRAELLERVWGLKHYVPTRTLDNHVARLRRKIEVDPADPRHVVTVHGVGYKLVP